MVRHKVMIYPRRKRCQTIFHSQTDARSVLKLMNLIEHSIAWKSLEGTGRAQIARMPSRLAAVMARGRDPRRWPKGSRPLGTRLGTWKLQKLSSRKAGSDSMISRASKSYTNEHTVCGRPTLKVVKHFWNGSVCQAYERSIYERTFLCEVSKNHVIPKDLSTGALNVFFRRDSEPSRIPARTHNVWANKTRKVRELRQDCVTRQSKNCFARINTN